MDKTLKTIIWPVLAIPLIYLAIVWNNLPESVAIHFDLTGNANRFGSKNELLIVALILTVVDVAVYLLFTYIYRIDPKKYSLENKTRFHRLGFAVSAFIAAVLCMIIYSATHYNGQFNTKFIFSGVGLLFCFVGNYIHNIKPNYFAGIRLPWTLKNADNWRMTHLLAGKLFFAGGLLIAVISLITPALVALIALFVVVTAIAVITGMYSYRLHKQQDSLSK